MKKGIIIGAGIAGLSAGIFAQENGLQTEIFEKHNLPGGLCSSWNRSGYTFDGCIRYVYGSGQSRMCNSVMRRIGAADTTPYIHHDETIRIETSFGETVVFHCDLDKLQEHLIAISPEDGNRIRYIIDAAKNVSRVSMPTGGPGNLREWGELAKGMVFFIPQVIKNGKITLAGFASGFQSAALREAFKSYYGYAEVDDLPLFYMIMDLAQHHVRNAGWPLGGSLVLAHAVEKRYLELGGKIHYKSNVERILTDNCKASGIRLSNGEEYSSDFVISATDAHATLDKLLMGRFTPPEYAAAFQKEKIITPFVQVSLGVGMDLGSTPHNLLIQCKKPLTVAGRSYDQLSFKHYCYDKSMAAEGKSVVVAMLETDYDAWLELATDREAYRREKQSAAAQVISLLDERYPGLAGKVEATDVSTPLTTQRYTGNFRGSPQGWQTTVGHTGNFPNKLPELENFYMAGQWVQRGGGITGGAMSALSTIRRLCKDNKMRFK